MPRDVTQLTCILPAFGALEMPTATSPDRGPVGRVMHTVWLALVPQTVVAASAGPPTWRAAKKIALTATIRSTIFMPRPYCVLPVHATRAARSLLRCGQRTAAVEMTEPTCFPQLTPALMHWSTRVFNVVSFQALKKSACSV